MQFKSFMEALKGKQHKIDKNKNNKIDAHDFKLLRKEEAEESAETIEESEERMARADYKVGASGRKSHKEIVFGDAESKDDDKEDKKEMKEAKMSDADMAERERIVKGMKKNLTGFKARYGKDAKSVMYATATKQAMKEETVEEAVNKSDVPAYLRKKTGDTLTTQDLEKERTQNRSHPETIKKINGTQVRSKMSNEEKLDEYSMDNVRKDAESHLKKSLDKQSDDRIAAHKNPPAKKGFFARVGQKQINMVKGAYKGLTKEETEQIEERMVADEEGIAKKLVAKHGRNVNAHDIKLAIHLHPEGYKTTHDRIANHVNRLLGKPVREEVELDESVFADKAQATSVADKLKKKHDDGNYSVVADKDKHRVVHSYHSDSRVKKDIAKLNEEQIDEKSDQAKRNKTMKNMMDASRGARYKLKNPVPDADPEHKNARAHNVAIGRALRSEEKKDDVPFDGPYTKSKPAKNSDGTTQSPMSRARQLAKDAMKKQMKEDIDRLFEKDEKEYGYEGDMAMNQLSTLIRCAEMIKDTLKPDTDLPEWVQSKITLASDYIVTAADYLHSELEEQAPVAPVPDKKYIKGTPENKAYKATKKPINGMPTNVKESFDSDGNIINNKVSYKEFAMMLEYEAKDGVYRNKGTYGGSYTDPEGADDADDKKPKQQSAEKRGRGRPAGAKSGAGKITGTSKLYK
jgi:hypothetical protein